MDNNFLQRAQKLIAQDAKDDMRTGRITNRDASPFAQNSILESQGNTPMGYDDDLEEKDGAYDASASFAMKGKSKLPKIIEESMRQNPIGNQSLDVMPSVLDEIQGVEKLQKTAKPRQSLREQAAPNGSGVDYSLIKTIVEECVKKYSSGLKKTMLNESKDANTLQAMKIGNKFTFIDGKGNLYEAQLKFIKNINQK